MPELTLFTAPKPFTDTHIATIQRNAIRSWQQLGSGVEVLLLGEEKGMAEEAQCLGVSQITEIARNASGTPLISALFETARARNASPLLAYVNADILLFPDFLTAALKTMTLSDQFLLVGRRWDMDITRELGFTAGWQERLKKECLEKGSRHKPSGSDYFIYPRACFKNIPDFAIGRAGWDNWMIFESRRQGWKTIDASEEIHIIHQNHDYSHLPGGQAHYRLPETEENVKLAGGQRAIFTLADVNYEYRDGSIKRPRMNGARLLREVEIFPLIYLKSKKLGEVFHLLLHPRKLWAALRAMWIRKNREGRP